MARRGPAQHRLRRVRPLDPWASDRRRPRSLRVRLLGAVLRALRRPAGRSSGAVVARSLRALHRDAAGWLQGHPRPGRVRRQGPGDDVHRGLPRLQGRARQAADPGVGAPRGRGGVWRREPARVPGRQRAGTQGRRRPDLRHQHVGPQYAGDHDDAPRPLRRGDLPHRGGPRPALRLLRVGRRQPEPRPRPHPRGSARRRRPHHDPRLL